MPQSIILKQTMGRRQIGHKLPGPLLSVPSFFVTHLLSQPIPCLLHPCTWDRNTFTPGKSVKWRLRPWSQRIAWLWHWPLAALRTDPAAQIRQRGNLRCYVVERFERSFEGESQPKIDARIQSQLQQSKALQVIVRPQMGDPFTLYPMGQYVCAATTHVLHSSSCRPVFCLFSLSRGHVIRAA